MIYLVAGLDRSTLTSWHDNVMAADVGTAAHIARARAAAQGIQLVIAAVVGPYSSVVAEAADSSAPESKAA
jgi:hypothetical protein